MVGTRRTPGSRTRRSSGRARTRIRAWAIPSASFVVGTCRGCDAGFQRKSTSLLLPVKVIELVAETLVLAAEGVGFFEALDGLITGAGQGVEASLSFATIFSPLSFD